VIKKNESGNGKTERGVEKGGYNGSKKRQLDSWKKEKKKAD